MFGYLRVQESELLVKDHELYRALYCGLCKTMRKKYSFAGALSLNYDFVFLALLRAELDGEIFSFCQRRCPLHPFKRRNCTKPDSATLDLTAMVHLALTHEKVRDDLRDCDTKFFKRFICCLYYPFIHADTMRLFRKDERFRTIFTSAKKACEALCALEKAGERDLDELAYVCAQGIADACCVGLEGDKLRLMQAAASTVGRLVYLLDACDDLERDAKCGSFNPYISAYTSYEEALERMDDINCALSLYARQLDTTVGLIANPARYARICQNITTLGVPGAIRRVIESHRQSNDQ